MQHVLIGRNPGCVEPDQRTVGYEIAPRGQAVVEMVGGNVSQVCQSRRQQHRVVIDESHQQQPRYRILPCVEEQVDLALLASNVPLVKIKEVVNIVQDPHPERHTSSCRRTGNSPNANSDAR